MRNAVAREMWWASHGGKLKSMKPFYESSEQNKEPILKVLRQMLVEPGSVLEIGSGTGQHAVHFAKNLPHLIWQPSDVAQYLPGIRMWVEEARLHNVRDPLVLDVSDTPWPVEGVDAVYSANTAHIMHWPQVVDMFRGVGEVIQLGGFFCLYGPFSYGGDHISDSNRRFHLSLQARDPEMGVRDVEALTTLAAQYGMNLIQDFDMPVNNRTLVWRRDF